ncbi:MAG: hypothetical protein ACFHHU_13250 [Porticoccaceae bacterium]
MNFPLLVVTILTPLLKSAHTGESNRIRGIDYEQRQRHKKRQQEKGSTHPKGKACRQEGKEGDNFSISSSRLLQGMEQSRDVRPSIQ